MSKFITIAIMLLAFNTFSQSARHPVDYLQLGRQSPNRVEGLYEMKDSSIMVLQRYTRKLEIIDANLLEIQVKEIDYLRVRTKRNFWKGALIGGAVGFFMGYALVGFGDNPGTSYSPSSKELGVILGTTTGVAGFVFVGLAAKTHLKIPIGGKQDVYEKRRDELLPYLLKD